MWDWLRSQGELNASKYNSREVPIFKKSLAFLLRLVTKQTPGICRGFCTMQTWSCLLRACPYAFCLRKLALWAIPPCSHCLSYHQRIHSWENQIYHCCCKYSAYQQFQRYSLMSSVSKHSEPICGTLIATCTYVTEILALILTLVLFCKRHSVSEK